VSRTHRYEVIGSIKQGILQYFSYTLWVQLRNHYFVIFSCTSIISCGRADGISPLTSDLHGPVPRPSRRRNGFSQRADYYGIKKSWPKIWCLLHQPRLKGLKLIVGLNYDYYVKTNYHFWQAERCQRWDSRVGNVRILDETAAERCKLSPGRRPYHSATQLHQQVWQPWLEANRSDSCGLPKGNLGNTKPPESRRSVPRHS